MVKTALINKEAGHFTEPKKTNQQIARLIAELLKYAKTNGKPALLATNGNQPQEIVLRVNIDNVCYTLLRTAQEAPDETVHLSPRECEIIRLVTKGHPNKRIAAVLDISPWTVATHMRRIFIKLGVNSRAQMVAKIMKEGWLAKSIEPTAEIKLPAEGQNQ